MKAFHKIELATLNAVVAGRAKPGQYADGGGLYLYVKPNSRPYWLFRYSDFTKKLRYHGLGHLTDVPAKLAREEAGRLRVCVREGRYPHEERADREAEQEAARSREVLVKDAVADFMREAKPPSKNAAHARQWEQTLEDYVVTPMGHLKITELKRAHVIDAIRLVWKESPETARKTLGRLRRVLDREIALGRIEHNVATLGPIKAALGDHRRKTIHHAALTYPEVPAFLAEISEEHTVTAAALRFLTLTAARTIEVRSLRWRDLDRKARLWTKTEEQTKTGVPHRVPLSRPALAILDDIASAIGDEPDELVFPGEAKEGMLSENSLLAVMKRHGLRGKATPHGMRSAFRTWCSKTGVQFEIAEEALNHLVGDETVRAYERPDYLDERRPIMENWGRYCVTVRRKRK